MMVGVESGLQEKKGNIRSFSSRSTLRVYSKEALLTTNDFK